ncbi:MAG: AAA family ATPase [Bacteroidales bacterium]|nr:AAA family ATPase [Bacteroidales bacterium]
MITELRLRNWKSFSDATLFIDPITVIIGTNASGKSNIFDALKLLSALASPVDIVDIVKNVRGGAEGIIRRGEQLCNLTITMEGDKSKEQLIFDVALALDEQRNVYIKDESLILNTTKKNLVLFERKELDKMNKSLVSVALYTEGKPRYQNFSAKTSVLSQIEYVNCVRRIKDSVLAVVDNLKKIRMSNPIPERMRDFAPLSKTIAEDASDLAGYLANLDEKSQASTYEAILKYLKPLPDRDIKSIRADKIPMTDKAMLFCTEEWTANHTQEQSALGMSDGTLRFAGIIAMLVTAEDKALILLEELDKGVHPSRAKDLVKMLKEIGKQKQLDIICTTHNATFVDELGPQMIPFISYIKRNDENGCTDIHLLEENEQLARLMASKSVGDMMTNNDL